MNEIYNKEEKNRQKVLFLKANSIKEINEDGTITVPKNKNVTKFFFSLNVSWG